MTRPVGRHYPLNLSILSASLAICRLSPDGEIPRWVWADRAFLSITHTPDELSIVCPADRVPLDVRCEKGWAAFKVKGPLDFSLSGVLTALAGPLAESGIPIFAISTFDTDYLLVREKDLPRATEVLRENGHSVE